MGWANDSAKDITQRLDSAGPYTSTLTYDNAHELTGTITLSGTTPTKNVAYTYNQDGDRTNQTDSVSGAKSTFGYDQADRLITATTGITQASYSYDGDGLRQSKITTTQGTTTTAETWDTAAGLPTLLQDGAMRYIAGPDGLPIEQIDGNGNIQYYLHDQLGSTRALLDGAGHTVATYSYDAYGTPTGTTGSATTPFGHAGQYTDAETGFQYLQARYYDPATQQFMSVDPLVDQTGQPYAYTTDDPLNMIDPWGLRDCVRGSIPLFSGLANGLCNIPDALGAAQRFTAPHPDDNQGAAQLRGEGAAVVDTGASIYSLIKHETVDQIPTFQAYQEQTNGNPPATAAADTLQQQLYQAAVTYACNPAYGNGYLAASALLFALPGADLGGAADVAGDFGTTIGRGAHAYWDSVSDPGPLGIVYRGGRAARARPGQQSLFPDQVPSVPANDTGVGATTGSTAATINGNDFHYDILNGGSGLGGPSQLQARYPDTTFGFTANGQPGVDIAYKEGPHPSEYPDSKWPAGYNHGDFKPQGPGSYGWKTFMQDMRAGKRPLDTVYIPYDPASNTLLDQEYYKTFAPFTRLKRR